MSQRFYLFWYVLLSLVLVACSGEPKSEERLGRYGMLDKNAPEYAAMEFMKSIYLDNNIDTAVSLSTETLARVLKRYHTNRNVQRHVLNLQYDTVAITPEGSDSVGRSEYSEKATITLFFSGMHRDDKIEDLRQIDLVKVDGEWRVSKVHADRFL